MKLRTTTRFVLLVVLFLVVCLAVVTKCDDSRLEKLSETLRTLEKASSASVEESQLLLETVLQSVEEMAATQASGKADTKSSDNVRTDL